MRLLVLSVSVLWASCLGASCAIAQTGQWQQAEDQIPPYRTHVDRRHGHDHVYPDRGAVIRDLPQGATAVNYAGIAYQFVGGVWYQRQGPAYIVVAPPIGLVVPQLPAFATGFQSGGKAYLYADDVFYRPRPDLGGYEVVNDPRDTVPEQAQAPPGGSLPPAPATPPPNRVREASAAPEPPGEVKTPEKPEQAKEMSPPPAITTAGSPGSTGGAGSAAPATPAGPAVSSGSSDVTSAPANPTGVSIQPHKGQSADQQAIDRYECYRFAVAQTGFDPLALNSGASPADIARRNSDYARAQAACLEGRGYTVPGG